MGDDTPPATPAPVDRPADTELVAAAQRGDRAALEQLLRRHYDRVLLLCRRICRNHHDAEDCAQNSLIAITRALERFDGTSSFATWSYRVTTNTCLDELRRRGRRPHLADNDAVEPCDDSAGSDPEQAVLQHEQRRVLQSALDQLPEEFRLPVVLRDVAGYDYAEIAQTLDLAPGTVRSRIARGRRRLAAELRSSTDSSVPSSEPGGNHSGRVDVEPLEQP